MPNFTAEVPVYEDSPHAFTKLDELSAALNVIALAPEVEEILDRFGAVHMLIGEVADYINSVVDNDGEIDDTVRALAGLVNAYGLIMLVDDEYVEMKREQLAELVASDD